LSAGPFFDASKKDVIKAFRRYALMAHPDKVPDNPKSVRAFQNVNEAQDRLDGKFENGGQPYQTSEEERRENQDDADAAARQTSTPRGQADSEYQAYWEYEESDNRERRRRFRFNSSKKLTSKKLNKNGTSYHSGYLLA
jgi:DnaJ-class molecular chaperone